MKMGKRTMAALVAVLMTVLAAGAATAAQPIREPILFEDEVLTLCSFPVLVEFTANKEFVTFFEDRILVTGKLFVRLTNLDDPSNSLTLNISGPAHISETSERSGGRGLFLLFPEDVGGPGLILTTGRVDVVRGEDGFITNLSVKGNSVNICAALA
jgi:hypothetical protein